MTPLFDFYYSIAGFFVGILVGLTGVGGGSLMAPILILGFGVSPVVAVGTDLWFAAVTKTAGGALHHKFGSTDWKIVLLLAKGSVPFAVLTLVWLSVMHDGKLDNGILLNLLGVALALTAVLILFRPHLRSQIARIRGRIGAGLPDWQMRATIFGGAAVGILVTLTSVGAGALVAVLIAALYPLRLNTKSIVGTDIVHAVPLTIVAAIGHSFLGNVNVPLLAWLLVGSVPGIILGTVTAKIMPDYVVRYTLVAMLLFSAVKLILS